jgi:choline dehydrogenase-like flavoprotein
VTEAAEATPVEVSQAAPIAASPAPPAGWTARELATLAELADAFVSGDAPRRATLAAEAFTRAADPAQVAQLKLVLGLIERPLVNLALGGGHRAFRDMPPEARERYLLRWAGSRLGLRRSAFGALRKLMTFLAYADPGVDVPNPRLTRIGYVTDPRPVAPDPTPIVPTRPPFEIGSPDDPIVLEADAVVVGSGAGGGVAAAALAEAGRSVVVLEAGPFAGELTMPTNELDAFDRHYLNHGLLATWDGAITMLSGSGVGGGTLVNWMTSIAAPDAIRAGWAAEHGLTGVTGTTWERDIAALETELGVAESTGIPPKDAAILRGAAALGWEAARTRRNATDCQACGSCPFGCTRGTKQSGIRVHLANAHASGARIVPRVRVLRVLLEGGRASGRAVGVEGNALVTDALTDQPLDAPGRPGVPFTRRIVVRAPIVVLSAGALRTPAILQGSGIDHPSIGRYLRLHPVPVIAGRLAEPVDMWRGTMQGVRSLEFGDATADRNGYAIEAAPGHPGLLALALPWEGRAAHEATMDLARHLTPLIAVTRDGGEGRATLTKAGRVRLDYTLDAKGVATLRHGLVSMARLARAAGATEILAAGTPPAWFGRDGTAFAAFEERLATFDFSPNRGAVFSAHQMGSVRMGADPATHPCDTGGRVRAGATRDAVIGGLYVADGSLFPTGIGVNPMITVMALARQVTRTILAES